MPLLAAYIACQPLLDEPDYKELYGATVAFLITVFHLARTIFGLNQLQAFRKWALKTAFALERASYPCSRTPSTVTPKPRKKVKSFFMRQSHERNEPSHPPPTSSMPTLCQTHDVSHEFIPRKPNGDANVESQAGTFRAISDERRAAIENQIDCMLINNMIVDNEFIDGEAPRRISFFSPRFVNPHEVFVRWSVCYLAQFGAEWLKSTSSKGEPFDNHTWQGRRYSRAADVWATSSLRMETSCYQQNCEMGRRKNKYRLVTDNQSQVSYLSPALWRQFFVDKTRHLFVMEDVLENCMKNSSEGFPYQTPILREGEKLPSSGMYSALIRDIWAGLSPSLYDAVSEISPVQLHWFAIFISVARWNGCDLTPDAQVQAFSPPSSPLVSSESELNSMGAPAFSSKPISKEEGFGMGQGKGPNHEIYEWLQHQFQAYDNNHLMVDESVGFTSEGTMLKPYHVPVLTLQDQLGLEDHDTLERCSFQFIRPRYGRYLWRNRCVLQLSERIDNWLALRNGLQFSMSESLFPASAFGASSVSFQDAHSTSDSNPGNLIDYQLESRIFHEDFEDEDECEIPDESPAVNRSDRIFHYHRLLEISRLRNELAWVGEPLLDHSISFIGCAMESVRSLLAEDAQKQEQDWSPWISQDSTDSFRISAQLVQCLQLVEMDPAEGFDYTIKERLLWECQNGLVKIIESFASSHGHEPMSSRPQLIMLALLAFPGIQVECLGKRDSHHTGDALSFVFEIPCAPQSISVHVYASASHGRLWIHLGCGPNVNEFRWQDWRDAFLGRLTGITEWQRNHFMRGIHVNRTKNPISSPFRKLKVLDDREIQVFEGWQPFRARIHKFELQNSSLILVEQTMPHKETNRTSNLKVLEKMLPVTGFCSVDDDMKRDRDESNSTVEIETPTLKLGRISSGRILHKTRLMANMILSRDRGSFAESDRDLFRGMSDGTFVSASVPYFEVGPGALSDASLHVDSVLGLNASQGHSISHTISDSDEEFLRTAVNRGDDLTSEMFSASDGAQPFSSWLMESYFRDKAECMVNQVNAQGPHDMAKLAMCFIDGKKPFPKDRNRGLTLLERAVVLGKDMKTATTFVRVLLEEGSTSNRDEVIRRALGVVELLWRDLSTRFEISEDFQSLRKSQSGTNASGACMAQERRRFKRLVKLHLNIIKTHRTAEMMCDLANHLSTWGVTNRDERMAMALYESAVISERNPFAMVMLSLQLVDSDPVFAQELLLRATNNKEEIETVSHTFDPFKTDLSGKEF